MQQNVANKTRVFNPVATSPHLQQTEVLYWPAWMLSYGRGKLSLSLSLWRYRIYIKYCCSGCCSSWKCWLCGMSSKRGLITEKIPYEISKSWDFAKDFRISGICKISDFNEDFCKISRFQWRFLQDFQILVQILTYWFWISGWCDYLLHKCRLTQCTGRNLHSSTHYILCICDTDTMYKQVMGIIYMHACMQIDHRQLQA